MDVKTIIRPYAVNGKDIKVGDKLYLTVEHVWNANRLVRLVFPSGDNIEVHENELRKAIDNAIGNEVK